MFKAPFDIEPTFMKSVSNTEWLKTLPILMEVQFTKESDAILTDLFCL